MEINLIDFVLAILPILWLLLALLSIKMEAYKATLSALIVTLFLAIIHWEMPIINLITAVLEGAIFTLWPISLIVISAVFIYKVINLTGAIEIIKTFIGGISLDKRILVVLIGWCFSAFMEGVAGYGTAVAISAGMLWGMGLDPILASVACIIGNIAITPFGAISISILTTAEVTGLTADALSLSTILQFAIPLILTPFIMVLIISKGKLKSLKGVTITILITAILFFTTQLLTLKYLGTEMVGVVPPIVSLLYIVFIVKYINPKVIPKEYDVSNHISNQDLKTELPKVSILVATLPFILILVLFLLTSDLFPNINRMVSSIKSDLIVYTGAKPETLTFQWVNSPGILIITATIVGGLFQGASIKDLGQEFLSALNQVSKTIFTLFTVIATAKVISYSGMIGAISGMLIFVTGRLYPYIAPVIGMVGGFITGSGTSSGILFGIMHMNAANILGISGTNLVAANSIGASIGKVIAPRTIMLVVSTTGLVGMESKILTKAINWILFYIVLASIISGAFILL